MSHPAQTRATPAPADTTISSEKSEEALRQADLATSKLNFLGYAIVDPSSLPLLAVEVWQWFRTGKSISVSVMFGLK